MRRFIGITALSVVAGIGGALGANAGEPVVRPRYANMYGAVVLCDRMAEDTAANVRLVEYGGGHIVYRCVKEGQ